MSWFARAVDRGVQRGVIKATDRAAMPGGIIEEVVWRKLDLQLPRDRKLTRPGFFWALALCFHRHGCGQEEAKQLATQTIATYLKDEGIPYGHRDYEWTRAAAEDVARDIELDHWDAP